MAARLPWFRMYQGDWLTDLAGVSLLVEGAWIRIVCEMRRVSSGTLRRPLAWWARFLRIDAATARKLLEEIGVAVIGEVALDEAGVAEVTSRRVTRDLVEEQREREHSTERSREHRGRNADATPMQRRCNANATPESQSQSQSQKKKKKKTDAAPAAPCLVPPAAATASPAPLAAPPADLAPFKRWHHREAVQEPQRAAQARFVANWPTLLADIQRAYPSIDIGAECAKAYAWETANADRRKTPKGRPAFLRSWIERAQNGRGRGPLSTGTAPPVIGRTFRQREEDEAERISLQRFGQVPLRQSFQAPPTPPVPPSLTGGPTP